MRLRAVGLVVFLLVAGCSDTDVGDGGATTQTPTTITQAPTETSPPPAATTGPSPVEALPAEALPAELPVEIAADLLVHVTAGLGSVWATGASAGVPYLFKVDPDTGGVVATWALSPEPADPGTLRVSAGDRYVWVVLRSTVVRVDPDTGTSDSIDFGKGPVSGTWLEYPWDVAAGDGAAWVVVVEQTEDFNNISHLYKVDVDFSSPSDAIVGHTELGPGMISDLLVAEDRVWVLPEGTDDACDLLVVDPASVNVNTRIGLTGGCDAPTGSLAAGDGMVYVADWSSQLIRWIDPISVDEYRWEALDGNGLVAYSAGTIWVGAHGRDLAPGAVWGIDTADLETESLTRLDQPMSDLAGTDTVIWVIVDEPSTLLRLMPDQLPTTAAPAPTTTTTEAVPLPTELVFRPDGLGVVSFGDPPDEVLAAVESYVGFPPTDDTGWVDAATFAPVCPGPTVRLVEFDNLLLLFADGGYFAPSGTEQFVSYLYFGGSPEILAGPPVSIDVGGTVEELLAMYPDADVIPDYGRFGPTFSIPSPVGGALLWGELTGVGLADEIVSIRGGIGCGD